MAASVPRHTYSNSNFYSDGYSNFYSYGYGNSNRDTCRNTYSDTASYGYSDRHGDGNSPHPTQRHTHRDRNSDRDTQFAFGEYFHTHASRSG